MSYNIDINRLEKVISNRSPKPVDIKRHYAVAIPLIYNETTGEYEVVYEVRSKNLKNQPLEISFPGGKVEYGESYKEAAIRETCEELLIDRSHIKYLGELDYLVTTGTLTIKCFLIEIVNKKFLDIQPSPYEVDHLFTVPLEFLYKTRPIKSVLTMSVEDDEDFPYDLIPNGKNYSFAKGRNVVLFYKYKNYVIWGFTAKMTKSFIDILKENNF